MASGRDPAVCNADAQRLLDPRYHVERVLLACPADYDQTVAPMTQLRRQGDIPGARQSGRVCRDEIPGVLSLPRSVRVVGSQYGHYPYFSRIMA